MKKKILSILLATVMSVNISASAVLASEIDIVNETTSEDSVDVDNATEEDVQTEDELDVESDEDTVDEIAQSPSDEEQIETDDDISDIADELDEAEADDEEYVYAKTTSNMVGGYSVSDVEENVPAYEDEISTYSSLPSAYPSSLSSFYQKYPDNRDQNPYGTCWAFASTGLSEFDLINKGLANRNIDLSELQLVYFTYNFVTDPLGGTEGDNVICYKSYLNCGGNLMAAAKRLSQWVGSVNESDVPYNNAGQTINSAYAYSYDKVHLRNAYMLNIKSNPDAVKQNIINHGAVGASYDHLDTKMAKKISNDLYTYYDSVDEGTGHAIMIVGWYDNYSVDNYPADCRPKNNGAWLVRNSWGDECSYFWMSYENASLDNEAWAFDVVLTKNDEYDNNYQYDGSLAVNNDYYWDETICANIFTVPQKAAGQYETLKAVSISCLGNTGVSYSVDIFTDLTDQDDPTSGTLQESAHTEGETTYAGIYTIELADSVTLKPGSSYSVVVETDVPAINYDVECDFDNRTEGTIASSKTSEANRSFVLNLVDDTMEIFAVDTDLCIKAYTSNCTEKQHTAGAAVVENKIDATCTKAGSYDSVVYCKLCGKELSRTKKTIAKKGHSYGANVFTKDGVYKVCKNCKSKLSVSITGLYRANDNSSYYYRNGKVYTVFTGLYKSRTTVYYLKNGKYQSNATGLVQSKGTYNGWYYVVNGKLVTGKEDIVRRLTTWYYVNKNGKVDFTFTGIAKNKHGMYYLEKGRVNFKKNIKRYREPRTKLYYKIVKGKATRIK